MTKRIYEVFEEFRKALEDSDEPKIELYARELLDGPLHELAEGTRSAEIVTVSGMLGLSDEVIREVRALDEGGGHLQAFAIATDESEPDDM